MPKKVRLLNVEIDDLTLDELVDTFKEGMLMTLHVDMIMKLQKDREFHDVLPNFSPITCDSQILVAAARLLGTPLRGRVSNPGGGESVPTTIERPTFSLIFRAAISAMPGAPPQMKMVTEGSSFHFV